MTVVISGLSGPGIYLSASELPALPPRPSSPEDPRVPLEIPAILPRRSPRSSGEIPLIVPWICPCERPDAVGCPECCIDDPGLYLPGAAGASR